MDKNAGKFNTVIFPELSKNPDNINEIKRQQAEDSVVVPENMLAKPGEKLSEFPLPSDNEYPTNGVSEKFDISEEEVDLAWENTEKGIQDPELMAINEKVAATINKINAEKSDTTIMDKLRELGKKQAVQIAFLTLMLFSKAIESKGASLNTNEINPEIDLATSEAPEANPSTETMPELSQNNNSEEENYYSRLDEKETGDKEEGMTKNNAKDLMYWKMKDVVESRKQILGVCRNKHDFVNELCYHEDYELEEQINVWWRSCSEAIERPSDRTFGEMKKANNKLNRLLYARFSGRTMEKINSFDSSVNQKIKKHSLIVQEYNEMVQESTNVIGHAEFTAKYVPAK
jgi:hypothetical protein